MIIKIIIIVTAFILSLQLGYYYHYTLSKAAKLKDRDLFDNLTCVVWYTAAIFATLVTLVVL